MIMRKTKGGVVHPRIEEALKKLGDDISHARRVRHMAADDFARRVGISRATLYRLERGDPGIALNTLAVVLHALGLLGALSDIADPKTDSVGLMQMKNEVPRRIRKPRPHRESDTPASGQSGHPVKTGQGFVGF